MTPDGLKRIFLRERRAFSRMFPSVAMLGLCCRPGIARSRDYAKAHRDTVHFHVEALALLPGQALVVMADHLDPSGATGGGADGQRPGYRAVQVRVGLGGFHHAGISSGRDMYGGYCVLADIPIAIHHLRKAHSEVQNILIIDCDQHCGDGNTFTFEDDPTVFTFSIHQNHFW
jgi:hypothetical protein